MRPKNRQLSDKYKMFRRQSDIFYSSRWMQTFFNKFIKQGKKALSRKHMYRALSQYTAYVQRPRLYWSLIRIFFRLRIQFLLLYRRKGRKFIEVPSPVRRNKRDTLSLQTIYNAVKKRRERTLHERIYFELLALSFAPAMSTTLRERNIHLARVTEERTGIDYRWK